MFYGLVQKLRDYLDAKDGLNAQEQELKALCKSCSRSFPISCLSRADFEDKGFDTSSLSDSQMNRIATKMGDVYVENYFGESLEYFAHNSGMPVKDTTGAGLDITDKVTCGIND